MKAVYDKLLFILALLILAGSVAYFVFVAQEDAVEQRSDTILSAVPSGGAYNEIAAPHYERQETPWPAPYPQDEDGNWLFDVFTPPRIYWDPVAGKLVSEPWQPPLAAPPFALELVSFDQELFRVQLEAYFTGASPEDTIVQFFDTQADSSFRGTVGTVFENQKVRLDSFDIEREFNPDGSVSTVGTAVVTDLISDEQFTLTASQKLYIPGSFSITLRTTAPLPVETVTWKDVGDKHEVGEVVFVLNAFDLDAQTVTVTKTSPQLEEAEEAVLTIVAPAPSASSSPQSAEAVQDPLPQAGNSFEDLFR